MTFLALSSVKVSYNREKVINLGYAHGIFRTIEEVPRENRDK